MSKLIADSETGTIRLETVAGDGAPSFAQGQPVTYECEYTPENMLEAMEYFEKDGIEKKSVEEKNPSQD